MIALKTCSKAKKPSCTLWTGDAEAWQALLAGTSLQLAIVISFQLLFVSFNISSAQEVVLRDLSIISSVAVKSVDDEHLSLTDGQQLTWDKILQARVDPVWQKQVNQRINKFGGPLYRLKHRLSQNNIRGAYQIAKEWHENAEQQFVGNEANFLVSRAVMLGRIRAGERELALEPMLKALILQQDCSQEFLDSVPNLIFASDELKTGICKDLLPIWNSREESKAQLNRLIAGFDLDGLTSKWPGLTVYLSSMAVRARQRELANGWNAVMRRVPELRGWQQVLGSNLSQTPLSILIRDSKGLLRVSTMYWWATDQEQLASKADRVLTLLKIVANYGTEYPDLSKMALANAIELTEDPEIKRVISKAMQPN